MFINLIKRIRNSLASKSKRKHLMNSVLSKGGLFSKKIRIIVDGTFNCGKNCTFSSEGIDNCRSTIQIIFGGHLEFGDNSGFTQSLVICTKLY